MYKESPAFTRTELTEESGLRSADTREDFPKVKVLANEQEVIEITHAK